MLSGSVQVAGADQVVEGWSVEPVEVAEKLEKHRSRSWIVAVRLWVSWYWFAFSEWSCQIGSPVTSATGTDSFERSSTMVCCNS